MPGNQTGMKEHTSQSVSPEGEPQPSGYHRLRKWTYDLVQSPEIDSKAEQYVRAGIAILIMINVAAVMVETVEGVRADYAPYLLGLENFSVAVFTLEYLLRIWSAVEEPRYAHPVFGRLRYAVSFFALVDLFAILPFYLPMLTRIDLRTLRILRLLRLARLMKLGRYSRTARILVSILRNQREQLLMSMLVLAFVLVCSSTMIYYLEHEAQPDAFPNIPAALWWGIVTLTTIGYGDTYPVTVAGKICAAMISILSIGMVALPSAIIVSGFLNELEQERETAKLKGTVICPHCGGEIGPQEQHELHKNTTA